MSRFVLDCAVVRPVDDQAVAWMAAAQQRAWASSNQGYHEAKTASALLHEARNSMSSMVGAQSASFWGDPGTAVRKAVKTQASTGDFTTVCTTAVDTALIEVNTRAAAAMLGLDHRVLAVDGQGRVDPDSLPSHTILVTNLANREIGALQSDLSAWQAQQDSALVLDASCSFGWVDIPDYWDALVLEPRAWGAPPGAWPLLARTEQVQRDFDNVPAAVTAGLCAQRWLAQAGPARDRTRQKVRRLRDRIVEQIPNIDVHGGGPHDLPHVLSVSVLYVDGESLQTRLDALGFGVGSGSACASRSGQPSHVLTAIGGLTSGNVRIGLPPDTPDTVLTDFADALVDCVRRLRAEVGAP